MLNEIKTALETLNKPVFYGKAGTLDGDDIWDYIVFFRDTVRATSNKNGLADYFTVAIVQEEFVEDSTIYGVIGVLTALPGVRLADGDMQYQYTTKPNTSTIIEILTLSFVRPKKRGKCQSSN